MLVGRNAKNRNRKLYTLFGKIESIKKCVFVTAGKCQVTAMLALSEYLYVASTWGCIIILDNTTLTPCAAFRPHGDVAPYIRVLLPLVEQQRHEQHDFILSPDEQSEVQNGILSIGIGHRNMLANSVKTNPIKPTVKQTDVCLLSWLAEQWKYTCSGAKE